MLEVTHIKKTAKKITIITNIVIILAQQYENNCNNVNSKDRDENIEYIKTMK